jgi:hypothetical protein
MIQQDRVRRPEPSRTAPRRAFVRHDHPGMGQQSAAGAYAPQEPAAIGDVIGDAVNLGYGVIDEYLQHGRQAAHRIRAGTYTSADVEEDLSTLVPRLVRMTQDTAVAWLDALSASTQVIRRPRSRTSAGTLILIEVRSVRPAQVTLDLCPASSRFVPVVHDLHPQLPTGRLLTDVKFSLAPDRGHAKLIITVPDDLPAGRYAGVIVDYATNEPGGTLCVQVDPRS